MVLNLCTSSDQLYICTKFSENTYIKECQSYLADIISMLKFIKGSKHIIR